MGLLRIQIQRMTILHLKITLLMTTLLQETEQMMLRTAPWIRVLTEMMIPFPVSWETV